MKRLSFLLLIALCVFPLSGEDLWEGNATQIRRGEFDTAGLFALAAIQLVLME